MYKERYQKLIKECDRSWNCNDIISEIESDGNLNEKLRNELLSEAYLKLSTFY